MWVHHCDSHFFFGLEWHKVTLPNLFGAFVFCVKNQDLRENSKSSSSGILWILHPGGVIMLIKAKSLHIFVLQWGMQYLICANYWQAIPHMCKLLKCNTSYVQISDMQYLTCAFSCLLPKLYYFLANFEIFYTHVTKIEGLMLLYRRNIW